MEYIEYFFEDFWHFVELLIICLALAPKITVNNEKEDNK